MLLNFTICRNTKLEGAISGPDRAPILQAQIWARSGRAFHYWSGARQITLSGPHFSRSGPDRRPTIISARVNSFTLYNCYSGVSVELCSGTVARVLLLRTASHFSLLQVFRCGVPSFTPAMLRASSCNSFFLIFATLCL